VTNSDLSGFQFAIRDIMWATLWMAISASLWAIDLPLGGNEEPIRPSWFALLALRLICPAVAIGVLFRLRKLLWTSGITLAIVLYLLFFYVVAFGPKI